MRQFAFGLALFLTPATAFAQSTQELAQQYIALPAVQEWIATTLCPDTIAIQLITILSPEMEVSAIQMGRLRSLVSEELVGYQPILEATMIERMENVYSAQGIQAQIDWVSSAVGRLELVPENSQTAYMSPDLRSRMLNRQGEIMQILTTP